MNLRVKLSLAFAAVVALGVGAALAATERYLALVARDEVSSELERGANAYGSFLAERAARRAAEARVIAEEPRLKAAVRTVEIDQATMEDVADDLRRASGVELFALADRAGEVMADVSRVPLGTLADRPEFVEAAKAGGGVSVWNAGGQLYLSAVRPLRFGTEVAGFLVTGHGLSDDVLRAARSQTGCEVGLLLDGRPVAAAMREGLWPDAAPALAAAPDGPSELSLRGERFALLKSPHPLGSPAGTRVVLLRSLDQSMASHASVRRTLSIIGGLTLAVGLAAALVLARSLTGRLSRVVQAAEAVGRGESAVKVEAAGRDEVGQLAAAFNRMTEELEGARASLVHKEVLEKELQIAQQIQVALLPRSLEVPGYRVAARMLPAESVGGDLYDVVAAADGHVWLCIGDVTSHGVTPGLIMMMVQSALAALVERDPGARPSVVLEHLNRVIYANVHDRLKDDNYLTLTVLRSDGPGRFLHAGAHLDLLIRRASGAVERVPTPGVWVGLLPDIAGKVEEGTLELGAGDALVLYTDGLTESRDAAGQQLDLGGVIAALAPVQGAEAICQALIARARAHMAAQDDDITVVVVERLAG